MKKIVCLLGKTASGKTTIAKELIDKYGEPKAVELLKHEGISNINVDLIYAIPSEGLDDVKRDLEEFLRLDIPHISFYSLILEDKSILYHQYQKG